MSFDNRMKGVLLLATGRDPFLVECFHNRKMEWVTLGNFHYFVIQGFKVCRVKVCGGNGFFCCVSLFLFVCMVRHVMY